MWLFPVSGLHCLTCASFNHCPQRPCLRCDVGHPAEAVHGYYTKWKWGKMEHHMAVLVLRDRCRQMTYKVQIHYFLGGLLRPSQHWLSAQPDYFTWRSFQQNLDPWWRMSGPTFSMLQWLLFLFYLLFYKSHNLEKCENYSQFLFQKLLPLTAVFSHFRYILYLMGICVLL